MTASTLSARRVSFSRRFWSKDSMLCCMWTSFLSWSWAAVTADVLLLGLVDDIPLSINQILKSLSVLVSQSSSGDDNFLLHNSQTMGEESRQIQIIERQRCRVVSA